MQINYNILFIENDNDWIDPIEESIGEYLNEKGFSLQIKRAGTFPTEITDFNQYDIIVVDFSLDSSETGDKAIERIRSHGNVYTEILFYSSAGEEFIRKKLIDLGGLDGVYCSRRDELIKNLKGLIYTTIRKSQDLNNLRGLVMAETSELDFLIKNINRKLVENNKVSDLKISERKERLLEFYGKQIQELEQITEFIKLLESGHFSANFAWRTLCSFAGCTENSLDKEKIIPYSQDIIELRNLLAHHPEENSTPEEMKIKKSNGDIKIFTESEFIQIRKNIHAYKNLLKTMESSI